VDVGLIAGLIGGAVGIAGGAIGTYFSIKNTAGPAERSFMIRMSVVAWIVVTAFLVGLFMLPKPFNWLLWVPYGIALPLGIRWSNRRQLEIRAEEASARASGSGGV
jgi:uncharacterized membrane protein YfcA